MNIKSNIVIALLLSFLIGCIWSTEEDSSGVTGTGNNGVIAVSIKDNTVLQQAKRQALAANELLNISVSLYKESEPTKIVATQTESQDGRYLFSNVDYDTYAVRVDINNEKGGLEKGIVVNSGKIVPVVITINIYITQNITNIIQGNDPVYIDSILNAYNASLLEQLENGDYILKTIPGELEKVVLQQGEKKQEVQVQETLSSEDFISSSDRFQASSSSVMVSNKILNSSSITSSSSSFGELQRIQFVLNDENSSDVTLFTSVALDDYNFGSAYSGSIGSYDSHSNARFLMKFDLPTDIVNKKIVSANIVYQICEWRSKNITNEAWNIVAHRILVEWKEGVGNLGAVETAGTRNSSIINGATANEREFGTAWKTPMVGLDDTEALIHFEGPIIIKPKVDQDFTLNLTKFVQAWVESKQENLGVLLRDFDENPGAGLIHTFPRVCTSEHISKAPIVTIEYY